jgi:hypothetical protein
MPSVARIAASDGSGNASVATIQSTRSVGATTISVDTVADIPSTANGFYAAMGTPHTFTDPITSETITVISEATCVDFQGHIDTGQIIIDAIAPGQTDLGSAVGDIVIIKPTTQWGDNVSAVIGVAHDDNGDLKNDAPITGGADIGAILDGWTGTSDAWAYASSSTITVPSDATTTYDVGDYLKLTQDATVKYFLVTAVSATLLTVVGMTPGSPETVTSSAITATYYSKTRSPHGLPAGVSGMWQSWAPTWTHLTPGTGATTSYRYTQIGKTVHYSICIVMGTGGAVSGSVTFTLPTTAVDNSANAAIFPLGLCSMAVNGAGTVFYGRVQFNDTSSAIVTWDEVSGSGIKYASLASTSPFTWTSGSVLNISGYYEAK